MTELPERTTLAGPVPDANELSERRMRKLLKDGSGLHSVYPQPNGPIRETSEVLRYVCQATIF
jgi:hypothetical protein